MTTINLLTNDQSLIVLQKVKIASGDINSVKVHVDFDSGWDRYTARTATFYTSKDSTVHDVLLTDGEGTVPAEVLTEAGTLHIGVYGDTIDGSARKTSAIVSMKVVQGATSGETTLNPTKDLYQQYLGAMNDKLEPVIAELNNSFDGIAAEHVAEATENLKASNEAIIASLLTGDLLWTNSNPTNDFEAQTVALDLSSYRRAKIIFKCSASGDSYFEADCTHKDLKMHSQCAGESSPNRYTRSFTVTNQGVVFGSAYYGNSLSEGGCVPYKIFGYKY